MNLEKKYGQERLVSGCAAAMDAHRYTISEIVEILETGADADYLPGVDMDEQIHATPAHRNIRGKDYYASNAQQSSSNVKDNKNGNNR